MKRFIPIVLLMVSLIDTQAQCAMCRATLENSVNDGTSIVSGINTGILYLLLAPYLFLGVVAFFWYRASKKNRL